MKMQLCQMQYAVDETIYEDYYANNLPATSLPIKDCVGRLTKDLGECAIIPRIGESITDYYWDRDHTEHRVVDLCYCFSDDSCIVYLRPYVFPRGCTLHQDIKHIAELHGWEYHEL